MLAPPVIALIVLFGFLIAALCGNLLYWYETINSPEPAIPSPRPGVFICTLRYVETVGSHMLCVFTSIISPFCHRRVSDGSDRPSGRPPLILIHGIYNGAGAWLYLGWRFRKAGFPASTCSYRSFFTSPNRILQGLEKHVRAVEGAFPGVKPVFVCHSMGGLLVRHWLLLPGNKERAAGVLTLGTPHRGSKVAALGPGDLVKRIMPASEFVRTLQDAPDTASLPCVSLVSPTDEAVLPSSSLLPPPGWRMRVTHRMGHFSMLFCPRSARITMEELEGIIRSGEEGLSRDCTI